MKNVNYMGILSMINEGGNLILCFLFEQYILSVEQIKMIQNLKLKIIIPTSFNT